MGWDPSWVTHTLFYLESVLCLVIEALLWGKHDWAYIEMSPLYSEKLCGAVVKGWSLETVLVFETWLFCLVASGPWPCSLNCLLFLVCTMWVILQSCLLWVIVRIKWISTCAVPRTVSGTEQALGVDVSYYCSAFPAMHSWASSSPTPDI